MKQTDTQQASIFELDGIPKFSHALPLALQHLVAMIVGCVTPPIIVANMVGLNPADRVILIQAALVVSALSTVLQLFPIGAKKRIPPGLCPSCNHGHQLRLCAKYAGYCRKLWNCSNFRSPDSGRCCCSDRGTFCYPDPQVFPAAHYRNGCFYHRTLSLSYSH